MPDLTKDQREEVKEIFAENHPLIIASIKESIHEAIKPLEDSVNKSLGHHEVLMAKVEENANKIAQLYVFHNERDDDIQKINIKIAESSKDFKRLEDDLNGLGQRVDDNTKKDEALEKKVDASEQANETLKKVGSVAIAIIGIAIAVLELIK